jgi:hypothetical protein
MSKWANGKWEFHSVSLSLLPPIDKKNDSFDAQFFEKNFRVLGQEK